MFRGSPSIQTVVVKLDNRSQRSLRHGPQSTPHLFHQLLSITLDIFFQEKADKRPVVRAMSLKPDTSDFDIETECLYLFHRVSAATAASADTVSIGDARKAVNACVEAAHQLSQVCNVDTKPAPDGSTWADLADR